MSATIYIRSKKSSTKLLPLVKSAIEAEITRLEIALALATKKIIPFEEKYKVNSEYFITNMTAEDLEGNDDEYITWAGEFKLKQKLEDKLRQLREIEYDNSEIFY